MLRWTLLRMMLLLWMTRVTLQGGTGYQPQNTNGGGAQRGYGPNSNTANMKGNGYPANKGVGAYGSAQNKPGYGGYPTNGGTGMGIMNQQALKQRGGYGNGNGNGYKAPSYGGYSNLMGAHPQKRPGYGSGPAAANKGQGSPPGGSSQIMGYPNGGTKGPKPGYGAKAGTTNGQVANSNGYVGYPSGGAAKQPNTGSSQYMGYPTGGIKGPKPGYGAKAGTSNGQGAKPNGYGGYPNGGAANQPNTGSSQYMGYPNGGTKGPKPGFGARAGLSNGQGAKPNSKQSYGGYPNGGAANQPNTGSSQYMGYPNGGTKGPKPGYGAKAGPSNGQGAKPNKGYGGYPNRGGANQPNTGSSQYMGYPNSGTKGPKPEYAAKAGLSNGQGAKPNGYGGYPNRGAANQHNTGSTQFMGYPNSGSKGPKPGHGGYPSRGPANQAKTGSSQYMGYPNGGTKGPKPGYGVPGHMSKGPSKAANSGYMPVTNGNTGASNGKGPILSPEAASHLPLTSNTKGVLPVAEHEPNTGLLPEQAKNLPPVPQQTKGQNLQAPLLQGKATNSMAQPVPKFLQGPHSYKPSKAYKPPTVFQNKAQKPSAPVAPTPEPATIQTSHTVQEQEQVLSLEENGPLVPVTPQQIIPSEETQSTPVMQQSKIPSDPSLPQMKNPTIINPELTGQEQPNRQVPGPIPSKPDCEHANGQWVKLPSPGSGFPTGKGEKSSQPGFGAGMGGYPAQGMNNGYKGFGGYGNKQPAGPQSGQTAGLGSKGKSQMKYGIGGLPFGGSPNGYQTNPSGQYGNNGQSYGAKPYNPKPLGKYGYGSLPYNSQPLHPESVAQPPGKYDFGGLPYNGQPFGYGNDKSSGKHGQKGFQYGAQPFDFGPGAMSGKYGAPESVYNPETLGVGTDAKSAKYGNPAVSYELLGPVTDGQSVEDNRSLEALHQGPEIDGQKSIDNFGEGEIPPHPEIPGAGEAITQSTEKYVTGDHTNGRVQAEVVSFPAVPTVGPAATSLDGFSPAPVSVPDATVPEVPVSPIIPQTELLEPAPPQQIQIQQHLKIHFHPHGDPQTAGNEGKYKLSGFFGNKYQG